MSAHESWCDASTGISARCNCIASEYIDEIEALREKLLVAVEALERIASNGEGRGMGWTPAQDARIALAKIRGGE